MSSARKNGRGGKRKSTRPAAGQWFRGRRRPAALENHLFLDGNKRVGAVAALVFPTLNGQDFAAPEDDLANLVIGVARGKINKTEVSVFIRRWSRTL
jgi:hypothetical protein